MERKGVSKIDEGIIPLIMTIEICHKWLCSLDSHSRVRGAFNKKNCIFYDIWQKGRGSKDQNQISEKNLNLDKVLGGVGKRLQCHKNSYLKNLVFYCLFCQKISIFYTPLSSLWHFYYYNCLCLWHLLLLQLLLHR